MSLDRSENIGLFKGWRSRLAHLAARLLPSDMAWYRGRPIVSFTFDDFPLSAVETAAPILKRHDVRATFYAATGLLGGMSGLGQMAALKDLKVLEAAGHEIGLHTHAHKRAWEYEGTEFQSDLARNERVIRSELGFYQPETFAYPYGIGDIGQKRWLSTTMRASRSVQPGINAGIFDLQFLRAYELIDSALSADRAARLIDEALKAQGWLVFVSHDVSETPSPYGVTPALLESAIVYAKAQGAVVLPVCEALDLVGVRPQTGFDRD